SVFPDLIFSLNLDNLKNNKNPDKIGFAIVSENKIGSIQNKDKYVQNYLELIEKYTDKGKQVLLFSFCKKEGDEDTINKIYKNLKSDSIENTEKVYYRGDIDEFLLKYSSVDTMYCGRFHSMIISLILNQKVLPINYSN